MRCLLTVAGFDPSSGAGVTADLAVFAAHGWFGCSAITALTVQATTGVRRVLPVQAKVLAETLALLEEDLPPVGIKVGMLATRELVEVVAAFLEAVRVRDAGVPVVLDPVLRSSSGRELLEPEGVAGLRDRLLPLVDWVTPNWAELALLSGREVCDEGQAETAVRTMMERYPGLQVVATGGDQKMPDDLVATRDGTLGWLRGERLVSRATHGTGCAYASALLCGLLAGKDGMAAAADAKQYVAEAIRKAAALGAGRGPMNLLWPLQE